MGILKIWIWIAALKWQFCWNDKRIKWNHKYGSQVWSLNRDLLSLKQEKLKTKEFDGIPLSPKTASELQDFLLVDKYKTVSGETLTDFDKAILELKRPENHEQKVKVALLLKILEKDPTLSTIQKTGVTKKSNQLFTEVARQVQKDKKSAGGTSSIFSNL